MPQSETLVNLNKDKPANRSIVSERQRRQSRPQDISAMQIQSRSLSLENEPADEFSGHGLVDALQDYLPSQRDVEVMPAQPKPKLSLQSDKRKGLSNASIPRPSAIDVSKEKTHNRSNEAPISMNGYNYQPGLKKPQHSTKFGQPQPRPRLFSGFGLSDGVGSDAGATSEDFTDQTDQDTFNEDDESGADFKPKKGDSVPQFVKAKPHAHAHDKAPAHVKASGTKLPPIPSETKVHSKNSKAKIEELPTAPKDKRKSFLLHKTASNSATPIHELLRKTYASGTKIPSQAVLPKVSEQAVHPKPAHHEKRKSIIPASTISKVESSATPAAMAHRHSVHHHPEVKESGTTIESSEAESDSSKEESSEEESSEEESEDEDEESSSPEEEESDVLVLTKPRHLAESEVESVAPSKTDFMAKRHVRYGPSTAIAKYAHIGPKVSHQLRKPGTTWKSIPQGRTDYLRRNALAVIRRPPKIPVPRYVDDNRGRSNMWCPSGLARNYIYKSDFGRVPAYIRERRRKETKKRKAMGLMTADSLSDWESSADISIEKEFSHVPPDTEDFITWRRPWRHFCTTNLDRTATKGFVPDENVSGHHREGQSDHYMYQ